MLFRQRKPTKLINFTMIWFRQASSPISKKILQIWYTEQLCWRCCKLLVKCVSQYIRQYLISLFSCIPLNNVKQTYWYFLKYNLNMSMLFRLKNQQNLLIFIEILIQKILTRHKSGIAKASSFYVVNFSELL